MVAILAMIAARNGRSNDEVAEIVLANLAMITGITIACLVHAIATGMPLI